MANKMLCFFVLFTIVGWATGILVGPVRLVNNKPYITYQLGTSDNLTLLECPIKLQDNEELHQVSWIFSEHFQNEDGHYVWTEGSLGTAEGRLEGVVRLDRDDGNLELTKLSYNLAGYYSCSATAKDGTTAESAKWEVLIVDSTANSQEDNVDITVGPCKFNSIFKVSPIYPEPTVHSGLYSESNGGFIEEVKAIDWYKQEYPNKSIAYSHDKVLFEINRDTPYDVHFLNTVGVTKTDGTYLPLTSAIIYLNEFDQHGCPLLKTRAYEEIDYSSDLRSCRELVMPPYTGDPLTATVKCIHGYKPEGHHEPVVLTCNTKTWDWGIPNDKPGLQAFKCVFSGSSFIVSGSSVLVLTCVLLLRFLQQ